MSLPTTDLDQDVIAAALGRGTCHDAFLLCSDQDASGNIVAAINKWARHKPFRSSVIDYNTITDLDAAQKTYNFGLELDDFSFASLTDILAWAASGAETWTYNRPVNNCRNNDFRGYNHSAQCPIAFSVTVNRGLLNHYKPSIDVSIVRNASADFQVDEMSRFSNSDECLWGILTKKRNGQIMYHGWQEGDRLPMTNPITDSLSVRIALTEDYGTYQVCGLINKTNDYFYAIPDSYAYVSADSMTEEEYMQISIPFDTYVVYDENKNRVYSSLKITDAKGKARSYIVDYWIMIYLNGNLKESDQLIYSQTGTVPANGTVAFKPNNGTTSGDYGVYTDESGYANPTYKYKYRIKIDTGIIIEREGDI